MIRQRWTDASGARIHYLDNDATGPSGLPIVFSPGVVDDALDYEEMLSFFAPRRAIAVDVRGRGKSESPAEGYSLDHLADDLQAAIADAGLERYHLMTFSRGTPTAFTVAFRDPARVGSLSIGDYLAAEIALPPTFVANQWASRWRGRPMPERVDRHVIEGIQRDAKAQDLWDAVAGLGVPVLVAHGTERGSILREDSLERYRRSIPGVEIVAIAGSGHDLFRPDRLAYPRRVEEFVSRRADDPVASEARRPTV